MKLRLIHWIVFILLLFISFVLAVMYSSYDNLNVLKFPYSEKNFRLIKDTQLLKGEKVIAEFKAEENNLGIIEVRFHTFNRLNQDSVIFRLKEQGSQNWYYENEYKVDQFQPHELFPIGFPLITDSANKTYIIEIESVNGQDENAIAIDTKRPIFVTTHHFSKEEFVADKSAVLDFVVKKISNLFYDLRFITNLLTFLLIPGIFLLWRLYLSDYIQNRKHLFHDYLPKSIVITPGILLYVPIVLLASLFAPAYHPLTIGLLTFSWLAITMIEKLDMRASFEIALLLLAICVLTVLFKLDQVGENLAFWVYVFLVIGTLHSFIIFIKEYKKV